MSNRKRCRKYKKWKYKKKFKRKFKDEAEKNEFRARLITFNRPDHPATKFRNVSDYGKMQSQFLTSTQRLEIKNEQQKKKKI